EYETKKELFKVPFETRSIRYIDVAVTASAEDRAALETEMEEYTGQLKEEVTDYTTFVRAAGSDVAYTNLFYTTRTLPTDVVARLDSVKVGGVFGPYYNASDNTLNSFKKLAVATLPDSIEFRQIQVYTETIERTKTLSDSIFNALKKGADFEEVAKRYGQTGTASWISSAMYEGATLEGDDLNYITTITSLNKNELANLSISAGANIILQVVNKKADVKKYKVAVIKRTVEFSKETYAKAYNEFSQFIAANPTLDQLVGNAEDAGYRLLDKPNLSSIEHTIGGIRGTKDALRWAFAAKVGDVSGLYECGDSDHMLVVALAGITPEGYRPSDDPLVRTQLRADIVRNKKAEKLMTELKAAGATTLAQYGAMPQAVTDSVKLVTFTSNPGVAVLRSSEPIIAAYASVAQEGKLSAPLQGNNGVFVLQEYSKDKLNETYDAKAEEDNLQRTYGMMTSSFVGDLYQKAKVKDNRYLFF
ncbi:MAG: peptidylprolyl isomerase, partial [Mediterranea sp.]|nr:peptidylprolyl isomerase [Mediterranea sp.]